jgi:predicted oxidoreductase
VSRLAYGLGMLNTSWQRSDLVARIIDAIRAAHDNGITFFDTADIYAEGRSEFALGRFLKDSPNLRDAIVIQSKCGLRLGGGWEPGSPMKVDSLSVDLSGEHIVSAVESSLRRLGTDRLDVLLLHSPSPLVEPEEVAWAFDQLEKSGKVRYFGVCAHNASQIELLQKYVHQRLIANQVWLSLPHHSPVTDTSGFGGVVDFCRLREIQIQAFSPLKGTTIFDRPTLLEPSAESPAEVKQLTELLQDIARRHDVTVPAIMLAWLLRHPAGIVPIIGTSSVTHINENCVAERIALSGAEWEMLLESALHLPGA